MACAFASPSQHAQAAGCCGFLEAKHPALITESQSQALESLPPAASDEEPVRRQGGVLLSQSPLVVPLIENKATVAVSEGVVMDLDWGSVPSWIALVGPLGGAAVAAMTYRRNWIDRRAAQANKVAAWWDMSGSSGAGLTGDRLWAGVLVRNASDLPVYQVHIDMGDQQDEREVLAPTKDPIFVEHRRDDGSYV